MRTAFPEINTTIAHLRNVLPRDAIHPLHVLLIEVMRIHHEFPWWPLRFTP